MEDLISPPYPGEGVSARILFEHLASLREWVESYRDELGQPYVEAHTQSPIPELRPMPENSVAYLNSAITTLWAHFIGMRRIREAWDSLIRTYEDSWGSRVCVAQQMILVQQAALLFNEAFIPFEYLEARRKQGLDKMEKLLKRVAVELRTGLESQWYAQEEDTGFGDGVTADESPA